VDCTVHHTEDGSGRRQAAVFWRLDCSPTQILYLGNIGRQFELERLNASSAGSVSVAQAKRRTKIRAARRCMVYISPGLDTNSLVLVNNSDPIAWPLVAMEAEMKRRDFVKKAGVGSAALLSLPAFADALTAAAEARSPLDTGGGLGNTFSVLLSGLYEPVAKCPDLGLSAVRGQVRSPWCHSRRCPACA